MAQTLTATNTVDAQLEVSANGTTWTDISGSSNKISQPTQEADTGEVATLDGQYKIAGVGKFKPLEIDITILYTETAGEANAFMMQQAAVKGRPIYVRWTPRGGGISARRYFTADAQGALAAGRLSSFAYPGADAETAAPTVLMFKVRCTRLGTSTGPSSSASVSPSASASA